MIGRSPNPIPRRRATPTRNLLCAVFFALLAIPHARGQMPSRAIQRACNADVARLCPQEFKARDHAEIFHCMSDLSFAQKLGISCRCKEAWWKEHQEDYSRVVAALCGSKQLEKKK